MKILVSNDDGYQALGVRELIKFLVPYGEVIAVCPDSGKSGQSMALTFDRPISLQEAEAPVEGCRMYKVSGTPVDCVKLSLQTVLKGEKPDLVVAGINHGSNSAVNVIYSGTMGAVFEGCTWGVPSIGFSLTDHATDADFSRCKPFVDALVPKLLEKGLPEGVCLNVNIPHNTDAPRKMMLTRACRGHWTEEYRAYKDPHGHDFYWLTGHFQNDEPESTDTDEWALAHGIVSVTPELLDRTAPFGILPAWLLNL